VNAREATHEDRLFRLYQESATALPERGATIRRIVLDSVEFASGGGRTLRYFADKMPIGISNASEVTFVYLVTDPTVQPFRDSVERHRAMLERLLPWRLIIANPKALGISGRASGRCLPAKQLLALLAAGGDRNVAQLMVRNVDEAVVRELKKRAARRNHSAEQEHRDILEQALLRPRRRSLAEVLAAMPNAGEDADFERRQIDRRA
jgi:plasmid stability protein